MVKALSFKGDSKPKKRKRQEAENSTALTTTTTTTTISRNPIQLPDNDAADGEADEQIWVSADVPTDISGPTLLILPTTPPTCLASDANGSVFASQLENLVEDSPWTAEPHDVRQVWIANRVAGSAAFSFKGSQGRYLGADKFGILRAAAEAVGPEEGLVVEEWRQEEVEAGEEDQAVKSEEVQESKDGAMVETSAEAVPGLFTLRTSRNTYLAVDEESKGGVDVRADAERIVAQTQIRLRMQARFKPQLKANKTEKAREKISRSQIEAEVGRRLDDAEIKKLKRARKEGTYHEAMLDVKIKGKHDKFA